MKRRKTSRSAAARKREAQSRTRSKRPTEEEQYDLQRI